MKNVVLAIHVIGGLIGLTAMLLPLLAKKGGRFHRKAGYVFVAGMGAAAASGIVMSAGFLAEGRTHAGVFFGVLSLLLGEGLWSALSAIRRKKSPEASRRVLDYAVPGLLALAALGGIGYGVLGGRWLLLGFSTLSVAVAIGDLAFAARPLSSKMAWWYQHMGSMMGACIAAVTAFGVVNVGRMFGPLPDAVAWVPWVLPSAVLVPVFVMWIRHYRARFRELAERRKTIAREASMYGLLAAGLTVVMAGFIGISAPKTIAVLFAVNVVISFAIGTSLWTMYTVILPRLGLDSDRSTGAVALLVHAVAMTVGIFGGVFVALGLVGLVHPEALRFFPYGAVVRVAIPVTIAIVAVSEAVNRWRRRAVEAERERLKSELAAIHARINPHFLFNSLNTIAALVHEDADRAEAAVLELSSLFRHTLEGSKQLWVPLSAEIDATKSYLAFEKLRFGDRLRTTIEVDGSAEVNVPPLVLQPLVENAVKHGIRRRDGGEVRVRVTATDAAVALEVEDDGDGASDEEGTSTGEADLRRRLELVYDGRAGFDVDRGPLGGYRVRLTLPRTAP